MPPQYILIHLTLAVLAGAGALLWRGRPGAGRVLAGLLVLAWGVGFAVERRTDWAWSLRLLAWPDAVVLTNLPLAAAALLLGALWRQSTGRAAKLRAAALTPLALSAALWSYEWYFAPVPPDLRGTVDRRGYCAQTTEDSCSAAAGVM